MADAETIQAAQNVQQERDLTDYHRAMDNIRWLSQADPLWADGEKLSPSDHVKFLKLNRKTRHVWNPRFVRFSRQSITPRS